MRASPSCCLFLQWKLAFIFKYFIFKVLFTKCTFTRCTFYKHLPFSGATKTIQFNETISSSNFQSFWQKWDRRVWTALTKTVKKTTCIANYLQLDWLTAPESHWMIIYVPSGQVWDLPGQVEGDSNEHILFLKEHWRMWEQGSIVFPRNPPWTSTTADSDTTKSPLPLRSNFTSKVLELFMQLVQREH